jgi:hypothetical protein
VALQKFLLFSITLIGFSGSSRAQSLQHEGNVHVITRQYNILYFRVGKALKGSTVDIFSEAGEHLGQQSISCRRTLIDFFDAEPGRYMVRISKDSLTKELIYDKGAYLTLISAASRKQVGKPKPFGR